ARAADEHHVIVSQSSYGAEENLFETVSLLGRVLAIDRPPCVGPPAGPERLILSTPEWKAEVRERMRRARLVIIVLDPTDNVAWELGEAVVQVVPQRLVLVATDRVAYEEFRSKAAIELRGRHLQKLELPPYVEPRTPLPTAGFSGLIHF